MGERTGLKAGFFVSELWNSHPNEHSSGIQGVLTTALVLASFI
jgi:hypothetical protein